MDAAFSRFVEILLISGRTVALQLSARFAIRVVHNAPLLAEWRGTDEGLPASLRSLLDELLPLPQARALSQQIVAAADAVDEAGVQLGTTMMRASHGGGADRHVSLALHRCDDEGLPLVLLLRDATQLENLQHSLQASRHAHAAAMAMLRASPRSVRSFLAAASTSVTELRATLRAPARDQPAVLDKLARLKEGATLLAAGARANGVEMIADAADQLGGLAVALRERPQLAGNDLLSLAPALDAVASSVGNCVRMEEQRFVPAASAAAPADGAGAGRTTQPVATEWARAAFRRWASFLRHRGTELGKLARLQVHGAQLVPEPLRREVDDLLQHLLRNAVEHGVETPEERLAAGKPASGEMQVSFELRDGRELVMTVRDDGRGFDVQRIGRAAVLSGLLAEESLLEFEPGDVVGLIFKPDFSTEHLEGEAGRGRGMSFLRRTVARLGGDIAVATRPGSYTQFILRLPLQDKAGNSTG
jgi:signal transduction histidine kinase